jgi:translation initiation factor IF-2
MVKLKPCMMKEVTLLMLLVLQPVSVLGLDGAATAGDKFNVFEDEKEAKQNLRSQLMREQSVRTQRHITLDEIGRRIALGQFKELNVI